MKNIKMFARIIINYVLQYKMHENFDQVPNDSNGDERLNKSYEHRECKRCGSGKRCKRRSRTFDNTIV